MDERGLDPAKIGFRRLRMSDLPLMQRWLTAEHVRRWWGDERRTPEAIAEKYRPRIRGQTPTACFVIIYGDAAIGYNQTYKIADYPDYARYVAVDEDAAGLDLFIGEAVYLNRGLGAPVLRAFLRDVVFDAGDAVSCVVGPEPANVVAIRAYEKVGFRSLKTIQVPDEPAFESRRRPLRRGVDKGGRIDRVVFGRSRHRPG